MLTILKQINRLPYSVVTMTVTDITNKQTALGSHTDTDKFCKLNKNNKIPSCGLKTPN